ncbi:unnamed protein product [Fraxinus pennsylvanica]|uniref:Late embryogenesis abundant protein LEA-2 subgroup domain-containing protein n=1 Tax=Fraxinus pennsylvanica TaxID=56036 RepID=A0AAD1ZT41_9LAMI|nr:unnamed protein product [Fraxinus pennsylvanica]
MSAPYQREANPHFHPSQPPTRPRESEIEFFPSPQDQGPAPNRPRFKTRPRRQSRRPLPPPQLDHDTNPHLSTQQMPQSPSRPRPQNLDSTRPPPPGQSQYQKEQPLQPHPVSPYHHADEHGHDLTVLANFTNPNSKVNIDFSYVVFDLFYNDKLIATRYIEPFSVMKAEYRFADVHLMSSQVRLPLADSLNMQRQIENGRVNYEIRGLFRAKSKLGGFLRYSYWLSAHCKIVLGAPPTGILISKHCQTKRQGIS